MMTNGPSNIMANSLDAHDRPPESIKSVYKIYQKLSLEAVQSDPTILDFRRGLSDDQQCNVQKVESVPQSLIIAACSHLGLVEAHRGMQFSGHVSVYEIEAVPGELSNAWD